MRLPVSVLGLLALTLASSLAPRASYAAVGDAVVANASVANDAYHAIQPGSGVEWLVHLIFHEHNVEIYWYDGTNELLIGSPTGANWEAISARVTSSIYLRVKNKAGTTKRIGHSAVITKE